MFSRAERLYILDANINRFKEGARVLEDIARFILRDEALFRQIKALKHSIQVKTPHRAINQDVGGPNFVEGHSRSSWIDIVNANSIRMQEAARVLEEIDKTNHYKSLRFAAYDVHAMMVDQLRKFLKLEHLNGIYAICDPIAQALPLIEQIIEKNSIRICQLRVKDQPKTIVLQEAKNLKSICQKLDCLLIINDHLDIALAIADGVHLGQEDLPIQTARQLAPENFVIGATCRTPEQAAQAIQSGASYLGVGCINPSRTKPEAKPVAIATIQSILEISTIPVCVIGGIQIEQIEYFLEIGADMVAMSSALW